MCSRYCSPRWRITSQNSTLRWVASTKYSHAEFDDITDKGEALLSMDDISVILS
jgi:hypothetical protein